MTRKQKQAFLYGICWLLYGVFYLLTYPLFSVTVMLVSIPLTMLGGWFYGYRGAGLTILATIPFHYMMLNYFSNDPYYINQAFSPFGIGTQLSFSMPTALLRNMRKRYEMLNSRLEHLIMERTADLNSLAEDLVVDEDFDRERITARLLKSPLAALQGMQAVGGQLQEDLQSAPENTREIADKINRIIEDCLEQLSEMVKPTLEREQMDVPLSERLRRLDQQLRQLNERDLDLQLEGNWDAYTGIRAHHLYNLIHEAATNAIRHARATWIRVAQETADDSPRIVIENNGRSFMPGRENGMGIPLMRYRARRIGATLTIDGGPGKTTRVTCAFPRNVSP